MIFLKLITLRDYALIPIGFWEIFISIGLKDQFLESHRKSIVILYGHLSILFFLFSIILPSGNNFDCFFPNQYHNITMTAINSPARRNYTLKLTFDCFCVLK